MTLFQGRGLDSNPSHLFQVAALSYWLGLWKEIASGHVAVQISGMRDNVAGVQL